MDITKLSGGDEYFLSLVFQIFNYIFKKPDVWRVNDVNPYLQFESPGNFLFITTFCESKNFRYNFSSDTISAINLQSILLKIYKLFLNLTNCL